MNKAITKAVHGEEGIAPGHITIERGGKTGTYTKNGKIWDAELKRGKWTLNGNNRPAFARPKAAAQLEA